MTYSQVLAFGDSTTAGCELIPQSFDWAETKKLSFPNQLADKLNIPCVNLAWPGGSNDRSLRLLPEALLKYPNSLVLFTYTTFDRAEMFTTDSSMPQVIEESYTGLGINWDSVTTGESHQRVNTLYLKEFYTDTHKYNRYKSYNMLLSVDLLCQRYASNYLQIFLYDRLIDPPDYQPEVFNAVDKDHIYQFEFANVKATWKTNNQNFGSLRHWAKQKGYQFCPGGHIGQEAHDNFAIELYNKV